MTLPGGSILRAALVPAALAAGAVLVAGGPLVGQDDVELLARIHGTTPPPGYYETKARDPDAFRFRRAWMGRNPSLERVGPSVPGQPPRFRFSLPAGGSSAVPALREEGAPAVSGTFHVPLVLGEFADGPPAAYSDAQVQTEFFDGPNSRYATIEQYYTDISGGRIDLQGETFPWVPTGLTRAQVVGSSNGLGGDAQVGLFILEILSALDDGTVDWGRYDNDGPDGLPNSGDDDGFVDILAVMHPTWGGECSAPGSDSRIWSHKWQISSAMGQAFVTTTPATGSGGGYIKVNDYAIQPVERCGGGAINQIGVLAHELGHGFGLPDLYAVGNNSIAGIGEWGLMGSGSWGCQGGEPERPCHMSAWSKSVLGWVDVVSLTPGEDHGVLSLPPVESSGAVYRIDAGDGSGEYFLLENRQRTGFDQDLHAPGLLVWQIDPSHIESRWPSNRVNSTASHMGVWLRQADGRNDLATPGRGRGDAGDPYPGSSLNRAFHAGSDPGAFSHGGSSAGLTILDVQNETGEIGFGLLTRYQNVTVAVEGGEGEVTLLVDGVEVPADGHSFPSAPFQEHVLRVQGGEPAGDGLRVGFEWADDPGAPRDRPWVTGLEDAHLMARFGELEARLRVEVSAGAFGVPPGEVSLNPPTAPEADGRWFPLGTMVSLEAVPNTGYGFGQWSGAAAGQGNPAVLEMAAPADVGVAFELVYDVPESRTAELVAGRNESVQLEAENGLPPVTWFLDGGALPTGMTLRQDGLVSGAPLEDGSYLLQVRARDAQGLEASGIVLLEVSAPALPVADLTGPLLERPHALTPTEMDYLDMAGNRNGTYDLGDFRAFFLAYPDLPEAAAAAAPRAPGAEITLNAVRFPGGGS